MSKAIGLILTLQLLNINPAFAYISAIHGNLTYLLANGCGLAAFQAEGGLNLPNRYRFDEAEMIAWSDRQTDFYGSSDAGIRPSEWLHARKIEDRRLFHFPVLLDRQRVEHNSPAARRIAEYSLSPAAPSGLQILFFGIGMHVLQDSWAHEGYGPTVGHAWTVRPDHPQFEPEKALESAHVTWLYLDQWSRASHGRGCKTDWEKVRPLIARLIAMPTRGPESLNQRWQEAIKQITGRSVDLSNPKYLELMPGFIQAIDTLKRLEGNSSTDSAPQSP